MQKTILRGLLLLFLSFLIINKTQASIDPTYAPAPTPSEVLVVYNSNITTNSDPSICGLVQESLCLAEYYANARGIPSVNVLGISATTTNGVDVEEITKDDYLNGIKTPIENYLSTATSSDSILLKDKIKDIVLMKGVPLKINDAQGKSVDAAVSELFTEYNSLGSEANPYFYADEGFTGIYHFIPNTFTGFGYHLNYIVTRLDGQSVSDVKGMIDHALMADTSGTKYFVIDDSENDTYGFQDERSQTNDILKSFGFNTVFDKTSDILTTTSIIASSSNVTNPMMAYISDGVHATDIPMSGDIYFDEIANNGLYANGAVANTFESYSGLSVATNNCGDQNCIGNFIRAGGSGGFGQVYEPYTGGIPLEQIWMTAYSRGYTWGEAAYMGIKYINWQTIVLGDPLMTINSNPFYGPPPPPTYVSLQPGNGSVTVSFIPSPTSTPPVTNYVVTSSPGNIIALGTSSPIVVSGLTNGTEYSFTVVAVNDLGTSTEAYVPGTATPFGNTFPLFLTSTSGGTATATPSQSIYADGTSITLSAIPSPGHSFSGFTGSVTSSSTPYTFILTGTTTIQANFIINLCHFILACSGGGGGGVLFHPPLRRN